jgi:hypothetical protein
MKTHEISISAISFPVLWSIFAQETNGRYFQNIKGTTWLSGPVDKASIDTRKGFGLTYTELESFPSSTTIWLFEDELTIEYYNTDSGESKVILECPYTHDTSTHTLTLIIDERPLMFTYTPVSIGSYVTLSKKNK